MSQKMPELRVPYPEIEPFDTGRLKVSELHEIYYEQCGAKDGKPALFLHGGPGGGIGPQDRRYFDPEVYRVVLIDQRGSGKSTPAAELRENTTWDIVADIEKVREHLGIHKWTIVFGGSWGSTLSLVYAQSHPDRLKALVLRGIFLLRKKEIEWFYEGGAASIFPDYWEKYIAPIPQEERGCFVKAFHSRLTSDDDSIRVSAAKAWSTWEMMTNSLYLNPECLKRVESDLWAQQFARIECHYFLNNGFFDSDNYIIENVEKIRHIPCTIVHGRYDMVCPMMSAWDLHKKWPEADLQIVPDSGHSAREPATRALLLEATDKYKSL